MSRKGFKAVGNKSDADFSAAFHKMTRHLVFGKLSRAQVNQFRETILEENDACEWTEYFMDEPTTLWLAELYQGRVFAVLGAMEMRQDNHLNGKPVFYVELRCTFDRTRNAGLASSITSGKLLWIYALRHMYQVHRKPFYVWNHAIDDAQDYHRAMRMKRFTKVFGKTPEVLKQLVAFTRNMAGNETASVRRENLINGSYLFYESTPGVNYENLLDIFHNACQVSTRWSGGNTRRSNR